MKRALSRFLKENEGVSAIEAAFLYPVVIVLFLGGVETMNYLDAHRAVTNASFSLAQAASASDRIDNAGRTRFAAGNGTIFSRGSLTDVRVELTGVVRTATGGMQQDWAWSPTEQPPARRFDDFKAELASNIADQEGLVVAVVQANYVPIFSGVVPAMTFEGFHAKVPLKTTVALYR